MRAAGPAAEPPKRAEPVCPGAAGAACGPYACPLQGAAEEKNADSGARKKRRKKCDFPLDRERGIWYDSRVKKAERDRSHLPHTGCRHGQ